MLDTLAPSYRAVAVSVHQAHVAAQAEMRKIAKYIQPTKFHHVQFHYGLVAVSPYVGMVRFQDGGSRTLKIIRDLGRRIALQCGDSSH